MHEQHPLSRLKQVYELERQDIWVVLGYGVGVGLMSLATPVAVQALVSTIAFGALFQPLVVLTLILLASVSFSNVLVGTQFYVVEMLQRRLFVRFFGEAAHRIHRAKAEAHDSQNVTELANRFFDVMTLQKAGSVLLLEGAGYLLQTLIGMVLLAFYHPLLLAFDVLLTGALAFILFGLGRGGIATAIDQSKAKYAAAAWLEDLARQPGMFRFGGGADFMLQRTDRLASDFLDASARHFRVVLRQSVGALVLHAVASTLLLGLGGWMVIAKQLTLGQLIAAELVVSGMIYGFTRLGKTLENFYEMMAGVDKLGHLLELPGESEGGVPATTKDGPARLDLHAVRFHYPGGGRLLDRLEFTVCPGERIGLTGACRGGKSALLDLIFGLRMPLSGSVLIDGVDIRNIDLGDLRRRGASVHHAEVIAGTVLENLCLGLQELTQEEAFQALRSVQLLDEILALPHGINTELNHFGSPLQPEQCLRLTLARALASGPRLLLLNQVFDRLDAHVAESVAEAIFRSDRIWTLVVVSQNADVLARCDRCYRLEEGVLVEVGPGGDGELPHG
jgi:ABC-type bacteriocin/lantibiotic exporter with double-glycine peptidase domain